ncbi:hypothetical protein HPB49_021387 [Dermacentor silvarum]|uniref:Uncharacterized protein n=1 Tax=Dermacentor silvarum TaxID=543639 RepID=A0ACB8DR39_DERSI|nr:hypothetical protein HPB49_021387 [Dermacentor silvarum]
MSAATAPKRHRRRKLKSNLSFSSAISGPGNFPSNMKPSLSELFPLHMLKQKPNEGERPCEVARNAKEAATSKLYVKGELLAIPRTTSSLESSKPFERKQYESRASTNASGRQYGVARDDESRSARASSPSSSYYGAPTVDGNDRKQQKRQMKNGWTQVHSLPRRESRALQAARETCDAEAQAHGWDPARFTELQSKPIKCNAETAELKERLRTLQESHVLESEQLRVKIEKFRKGTPQATTAECGGGNELPPRHERAEAHWHEWGARPSNPAASTATTASEVSTPSSESSDMSAATAPKRHRRRKLNSNLSFSSASSGPGNFPSNMKPSPTELFALHTLKQKPIDGERRCDVARNARVAATSKPYVKGELLAIPRTTSSLESSKPFERKQYESRASTNASGRQYGVARDDESRSARASSPSSSYYGAPTVDGNDRKQEKRQMKNGWTQVHSLPRRESRALQAARETCDADAQAHGWDPARFTELQSKPIKCNAETAELKERLRTLQESHVLESEQLRVKIEKFRKGTPQATTVESGGGNEQPPRNERAEAHWHEWGARPSNPAASTATTASEVSTPSSESSVSSERKKSSCGEGQSSRIAPQQPDYTDHEIRACVDQLRRS